MKKILCLFSALTLVLSSSCSNEESSSDSAGTDGVLLKKTITTDSNGSKITANFTYDGNKIKSFVDDSGEVNMYYTYTGDLITKIEFKYPNGTLDQVNTYEYDSNKRLITYIRSDAAHSEGAKEVYSYNADGTVSIKHYSGNDKTQTYLAWNGVITLVNGEVISITTDYSISNMNYAYTYDDKNNAAKNIVGWDKIPFNESTSTGGILHNQVSEKSLPDNKITATSVYTYNSAGYPIKSVDTSGGETTTTEYFY